jgi:hypothetical protein
MAKLASANCVGQFRLSSLAEGVVEVNGVRGPPWQIVVAQHAASVARHDRYMSRSGPLGRIFKMESGVPVRPRARAQMHAGPRNKFQGPEVENRAQVKRITSAIRALVERRAKMLLGPPKARRLAVERRCIRLSTKCVFLHECWLSISAARVG